MNREEYLIIKSFEIEDRSKKLAEWLINNPKYSIRKLSKEFNISKSQVHRDLHNLKYI